MPDDGEIIINKWSPDTCGCILNYQWIRGSHEDGRVHVFHSFDKVCPDHENLKGVHPDSGKTIHGMHQDVNGDGLSVYNAVLEENQRKNIILQHALDSVPNKLARQKENRFGTVTNVPHENMVYNYFWTGGPPRVLNCSFYIPLTDHEKGAIENRFSGLVKVR